MYSKAERKKKRQQSFANGWYNTKQSKMYNGSPKRKRERIQLEKKNTFNKSMTDFFLNLLKHIVFYIQEMERRPSRINTEKITPRPIMIKLLKTNNKEKISQQNREEKSHYP